MSDQLDSFALNTLGVQDLIETNTNKVPSGISNHDEGVTSEEIDLLHLNMKDEELLSMRTAYENKSAPYTGKIEPRQKANKSYLFGTQRSTGGITNKTVPSNLLFQSTATFVPQALAKNPEPTVWSDNTPEGKKESNDIKTMLQFHADILCMRKKLGVLVWHWSVYFIGVWKYGWKMTEDPTTGEMRGDVTIEVRKPSNFVLDPDGFIDEFGDYQGSFLGERIQSTAEELVRLYPSKKDDITKEVGSKMGTLVTRTEWWTNDYSFTTYKEMVLDKHKNEFYNYDGKKNHFASPKMPYTFLSVFSLQEQPHDFTNLIEQNIANQDSINDRDIQIAKNLAHGNNSIVVSDVAFNIETAHQAADALEKGDPILAPGDIDKAIKRIPANPLPQGIMEAQENAKQTLLSVYGTEGVTAQESNQDQTARGMILNQSFDNTRIGGGVGDGLEQVADNAFNWLLQLYYVFYDEKHYASILGYGGAVEYVGLSMANAERHFVVSVTPNSMRPKDEISEQNLAMQRWTEKAIDPIGLMKALNSPDPMNDAKALVLWTTNPQLYLQQFFPEMAQNPANSPNPDIPGNDPANQPNPEPSTLSQEPASSSLSQVPLPQ